MSDHEYEPLKGHPTTLTNEAHRYERVARAITRSVTTLGKISSVDGMTGKAIDKLRDSADSVADDIGKAQNRYKVTADALVLYASKLSEAQGDANRAIARLGAAEDAADTARRNAHEAEEKANQSRSSSSPDEQADATAAKTAGTTYTTAQGKVTDAQDDWRAAREKKNDAAKVAIGSIHDVVEKNNEGLKDSRWDNIKGFAKAAYEVFKVICKWAGILAIFLSWVPFLGPLLLVLAAVGALLEFAETLIKFLHGDASLGDLLLAGVGAVLTIFGGKLIAMAAKGLKGVMVVRAATKLGGRSTKIMQRIQGLPLHRVGGAKGMSYVQAKVAKGELQAATSSMKGFGKSILQSGYRSFRPSWAGESGGTIFKSSVKSFLDPVAAQRDIYNAIKIGASNNVIHGAKDVAGLAGVTALVGGQRAVPLINWANHDFDGGAVSTGYGPIDKGLSLPGLINKTGPAFSEFDGRGSDLVRGW
ncbi:putative T7SS-secreted protein [Schumannella soli]|uniref:Putative T7SS secretion signal domain-containing protein n=1 Tax=Schumannella soli TaxID=2590779 RepID=A0A506Y053_9MICO|nr:hypothetical protein [Schumannella soli]TPW75030.1 hypothetical protein FJ657_12480 [Schumannella soli]